MILKPYKKALIAILPIVFTAQACDFLFGGIYQGDERTGPRGVFVSTDNGQTWQESNRIGREKTLATARVSNIIIEQTNPKNLIVTTLNEGVYVSDDAAKKWTAILPAAVGYDAFINPKNSQEIFVAGIRNGLAAILKSPDRGGTWIQAYNEPEGEAAVTTLAFDPGSPKIFYAGLSTGTVLKSTDAGATWNAVMDLKDRVVKLAVAPDGKGTVYLLSQVQGLRRSVDGGRTWTELKLDPPPERHRDLVLEPGNAAVLYMGTDKGLFKSTRGGAEWSQVALPVTPEVSDVSAVAINPGKPQQVFVGLFSTLYRSDDRGATWRTFGLPTNRIINDIKIDPIEPNLMYLGLK